MEQHLKIKISETVKLCQVNTKIPFLHNKPLCLFFIQNFKNRIIFSIIKVLFFILYFRFRKTKVLSNFGFHETNYESFFNNKIRVEQNIFILSE